MGKYEENILVEFGRISNRTNFNQTDQNNKNP